MERCDFGWNVANLGLGDCVSLCEKEGDLNILARRALLEFVKIVIFDFSFEDEFFEYC